VTPRPGTSLSQTASVTRLSKQRISDDHRHAPVHDIADGRIRAIYVERKPDKLRGFLERTH
jgi:hypothetical protein